MMLRRAATASTAASISAIRSRAWRQLKSRPMNNTNRPAFTSIVNPSVCLSSVKPALQCNGRNLSTFSSTSAAKVSSYDALEEGGAATGAAAEASEEEEFKVVDYFADRFDFQQPAELMQQAPAGSYMQLSPDQLQRILPEGFSGELNDEFEFTGQLRLMIREPAKLLFRLIEDTEAAVAAEGTATTTTTVAATAATRGGAIGKAVESPLHVPRLTDRGSEWFDCVMQVSHYGKELHGKRKPSMKASADRTAAAPDSDKASDYYNSLLLQLQKNHDNNSNNSSAGEQQQWSQSQMPQQVLLSGARGTGKSVALNQAVIYARQRGWLCFFVPSAWSLLQEGGYIEPLSFHNSNSSGGDRLFDNPHTSAELLRGFYRAHSQQLHAIPLQRPQLLQKYAAVQQRFRDSWQKTLSLLQGDKSKSQKMDFIKMRSIIEGEENVPSLDKLDEDVLRDFDFMQWQPRSLGDLVQMGVALRQLSGSLCADLIDELKTLDCSNNSSSSSSSSGVKGVMIAVDQYNCMEVKSAFMYDNKPIVGKDQLIVPRALHFISKQKAATDGWFQQQQIKATDSAPTVEATSTSSSSSSSNNINHNKRNSGLLCIGATSLRHPEGNRETFDEARRSVPLLLTVPSYSRIEFLAATSYYAHCQQLPGCNNNNNNSSVGLSMNEFLALRMQTGSNPRLLRRELHSFLLPRAIAKMNAVFDDAVLLQQYAQQRRLGDDDYNDNNDDHYTNATAATATGSRDTGGTKRFGNSNSSRNSSRKDDEPPSLQSLMNDIAPVR